MQKQIALLFSFICFSTVWGQNDFQAVIIDKANREPLVGTNVYLLGTTIGASSDQNGLVRISNIPNGQQIIIYSYIGYEQRADTLIFPITQTEPFEVLLVAEAEETEVVLVTATRSSRSIADVPTRVEIISGEELDEKANMKPGDIRMLLNESTGIQTQQTSATSYNSSIRIQGLDGKYTQILKDGFPLYSGFSGGLGLLQIVPLDLQQVEVIKGSSSTLYGGGAIAGLVNLVSKAPTNERELSFMLNVTSAQGIDVSGFYSQKHNKLGTILFASYNSNKPYDPAGIGLTAIPEFQRFTVNPKLFFYFNDRTNLYIGFNSTLEKRTGGDVKFIEGKGDRIHSYFEKNKTTRFSTQLGLNHRISQRSSFSLKNSISYYDRSIEIPSFKFSGEQISSFSEAAYRNIGDQFEWIGGLNLWTDQFKQNKLDTSEVVDYQHLIMGAFIQNIWNTTKKVSIETGLRLDYQKVYGIFPLPRVALLIKTNPNITFRFGGGLGYKIPTVFTEEAERLQLRNVLPIDVNKTKAEKSSGINFDMNYRTLVINNITFSINVLLFYTRINKPIVLAPTGLRKYEFQQPEGFIDTKGIETNVKLTYNHFKFFVGYTFANVNEHYDGKSFTYPLVAKHRLNNVVIYEIEEKLRIGLEAYYFSPQELSDGRTGREYWILGLMTEKIWEKYSIFLNFENFLDSRQTKFEKIYTGSISNPKFNEIYAPLDGFVINGGIKIRF